MAGASRCTIGTSGTDHGHREIERYCISIYFPISLSAAHILRSSTPSLFYCITSILQFFNSLICFPSSTDLPVTVTTTASSIKRVIERLSIIIIIMPRFFDDYSNTYLTHDSAAGRKQQRRGWKFRENFKVSCFAWFAVLHNNIVAYYCPACCVLAI